MLKQLERRDYSLTGSEAAPGFAHGEWYRSPVERKQMKQLMRRSDRAGLVNYSIWIAGLLIFGAAFIAVWGTWLAWPIGIFYGVFYASCADSRWHETSHGTVFRTAWLNNFFHHLSSFMSLKNPHLWRWSHTRHHTDTLIVGRDPEIAFPRPPSLFWFVLSLLHVKGGWNEVKKMLRLSVGYLTEEEKSFLIEPERSKAFWASRIHLAIYLVVAGIALAMQSWLPLFLVGLPSFYGAGLHNFLAATQHAGLAEDIPDHRLNTRTVMMNPFFRFVYSNMNYHVEHHMYPMVPFYNLPALHQIIRSDCPEVYPKMLSAYREMIPAMMMQRRDPEYYVRRTLPKAANPTPEYKRPKVRFAQKGEISEYE